MAEPSALITGPLDGLAAIEAPGVRITALPHHATIAVRGRAPWANLVDAVTTAIGFAPPVTATTATVAGVRAALWLGPGDWRITAPAADAPALLAALERAVPRALAGVVDVSDAFTTVRVSGHAARTVMARGCPLDLHPRSVAIGFCTSTLLAKATVLLHQRDGAPTYDIQVRWSVAAYLWDWLQTAVTSLAVPDDTR